MIVVVYIYIVGVEMDRVFWVCVCWLKIRRIEYMHRMGCLYKYIHARICTQKRN